MITTLTETSAKVYLVAFDKPEACNNPSRWLSQQATPPVFRSSKTDPGKDRTGLESLPGFFPWVMVSGGVARGGLNHRLGLYQASGFAKALGMTFAEVS